MTFCALLPVLLLASGDTLLQSCWQGRWSRSWSRSRSRGRSRVSYDNISQVAERDGVVTHYRQLEGIALIANCQRWNRQYISRQQAGSIVARNNSASVQEKIITQRKPDRCHIHIKR